MMNSAAKKKLSLHFSSTLSLYLSPFTCYSFSFINLVTLKLHLFTHFNALLALALELIFGITAKPRQQKAAVSRWWGLGGKLFDFFACTVAWKRFPFCHTHAHTLWQPNKWFYVCVYVNCTSLFSANGAFFGHTSILILFVMFFCWRSALTTAIFGPWISECVYVMRSSCGTCHTVYKY